MLLGTLRAREYGSLRPSVLCNRVIAQRVNNIELCLPLRINAKHEAGIFDIDIEVIQGRFMLLANGPTIQAYDLDDRGAPNRAPVAMANRSADGIGGHQYAVSSVHWYPHDTGMFVSASFDASVRVWDTNRMVDCARFALASKCYSVHMSRVARTHSLVAFSSESSNVFLCDLNSGKATHTLRGHRGEVWNVRWSPRNEFVLVSGACDGRILAWDIRKANAAVMSLDQHRNEIMASAEVDTDRGADANAVAHFGAISGLVFSADGEWLLSSGLDNRMRRWRVQDGVCMLTNYAGIQIQNSHHAIRFDISNNSSRIYHPHGHAIRVYELRSGRLVDTLRGHLDLVSVARFRPLHEQVYSGARGAQVLGYAPKNDAFHEREGDIEEVVQERWDQGGEAAQLEADEWSD